MGTKVVVKRTSSSDELAHHKYIKRVKGKNGKWRYYYDSDSLKKDIKDKLGYDERDKLDAVTEKHNKIMNDPNSTYDEKNVSSDEWFKADIAFLKTPLGKLEQVKSSIIVGQNIVQEMLLGAKHQIHKKLGIH